MVIPDRFLAAPTAYVALALLGAGIAGASAESLYGQIRDGVEDGDLECAVPGHVLVARPSLELACVSPGSADRLGWPKVAFSGDGRMVVNSTLEVASAGGTFGIGYVLMDGVIRDAREDDHSSALLLEVGSAAGGEIRLEIPQAFYSWFDPESGLCDRIMVLEGEETVDSGVALERGTYVVEFPFGADPRLEVALHVLAWHPGDPGACPDR